MSSAKSTLAEWQCRQGKRFTAHIIMYVHPIITVWLSIAEYLIQQEDYNKIIWILEKQICKSKTQNGSKSISENYFGISFFKEDESYKFWWT